MAELNNIQFENEQTIHQDSTIRSNLKRKQPNQKNKSNKRKTQKHEIWNHVIENLDKKLVSYIICSQSYNSQSSSLVVNLKNYFERLHKETYIEILNKELTRKNNQNLTKNQTNNQQETEINEPRKNIQQETEIETLF
ncbi:1260_t:CDS:1 [Scutellospora calospora]|uniref:1260_t:CDS:1 n=1 Tax=Scutellospora calospora TaxID=85575 RepID=A0ACA9MJ56_9GLOM|nr:1260_t:CDS:1 [Scutellospora calospora]